MIKISKRSITLLLFLMCTSYSFSQNKGRWIITVNHPKAVTYVDSIKFKDFDTRASIVGKYKVKSWRPGGVLIDTTIVVRKDSISFLKMKIKDSPAYANYKNDMFSFRVKKWTPKVIALLCGITLQVLYHNSKIKADELEQQYLNLKIQYDNLYSASPIEDLKYNSEKIYKNYQKEVKRQNRYSALRLIVPALLVTSVVIDLTNKKPAPYVEVPLLTLHNQTSTSTNNHIGINLICKF